MIGVIALQFVSTAWIPGTFAQFESTQCLSIHAEHARATAQNPLRVFVLEGFRKLPGEYVKQLEERHILICDLEAIYKQIRAEFSQLEPYLGEGPGISYESSCFLRWLVIDVALAGEPFVHFDLDLFFQENFDALLPTFTGLTGTFGSPCLTAISDHAWLKAYREALRLLISDPETFQLNVGFSGNEFRTAIGSDQDLIVQMERRDLLPENGMDLIWDRRAVFINPLHPDRFGPPSVPHRLTMREGRDYIDEKPVFFWHLQNNFADYLARFAVLRSQSAQTGYRLPTRLDFPIVQINNSAENYAFSALREICEKQLHRNMGEDGSTDFRGMTIERYFSRSWITRWFVLEGEGRELFSDEYWWQENVFESREQN